MVDMWIKKGATMNFLGGLRIEVLEVDGEEVQLQITRTGHSMSGQVEVAPGEEKEAVTTSVPDAFMRAFG